MSKIIISLWDDAKEAFQTRWFMGFSILVILCLIGSVSSCFLQDDNYFEEMVEEVIEMQTGLDLDLSPDSEEPSQYEFYMGVE